MPKLHAPDANARERVDAHRELTIVVEVHAGNDISLHLEEGGIPSSPKLVAMIATELNDLSFRPTTTAFAQAPKKKSEHPVQDHLPDSRLSRWGGLSLSHSGEGQMWLCLARRGWHPLQTRSRIARRRFVASTHLILIRDSSGFFYKN